MNIKCTKCGNGNVVSTWSHTTCFSCGAWFPGQARSVDPLGAVALAKCHTDPGRITVGVDSAGDYWENLIGFQSRFAVMSVIPQLSESMLSSISKMRGIPGDGPKLAMGVSTKDLSASWDGGKIMVEGGDSGRVMDEIAQKLKGRGELQSKEMANLAVLGSSMLSATEDCKRWILDGKQHSVIVARVPDEVTWANCGVNPTKHQEPSSLENLIAMIPRWGMPPAIAAIGEDNGVDTSSPFWTSQVLVPSKITLLADACEPQPILWSAINSNKGWSTARVAWFVSSNIVVTVSSSESMDDGTSVTTCVTREFKGHGNIRMSRVDNWKSVEEASDSASAIVEKLVMDHQKSGADFCADSWDFHMPEPHDVIRKVIEDRVLWSPSSVRLIGLGVNRSMIQWCTAIR